MNVHAPGGVIRHLLVKFSLSLSAALLVTHSWFLYLVFVFLLGAICTREALRYDFLIAEKVNA